MIKKVLCFTLALTSICAFAVCAESDSDRRKNIAKTLYGRIRLVEIGEDYRVRPVEIGEDLRVRIVEIGENSVGRWRFVDIGEDYRVRLVDIGEDLKVRFVEIGESPRR